MDVTTNESAPVESAGSREPGPSTIGSLIGVFTNPKRTFEGLAARPRVLAPILLLVVVQLIMTYILLNAGTIESDTIAKMEAKGTPPEQIEQVRQFMGGPMKYISMVGGGIAMVFILLVLGGLFYFVANLMMGARLRYAHYLCAAAYGAVVGIVEQAAQTALAVARGTMDVRLGLGALFGDEPNFLVRLLDGVTNPLFLWASAVMAIGVGVMARRGFGFGALAVLPAVLLRIILGSFRTN